jgi:hypothetical protein
MTLKMLPNQVTRKVGCLLLLRQNHGAPSDENWAETLKLMSADAGAMDQMKVLVVTDGGGPTPDQRKRLERTMSGKTVPTAVVSDSVKVRFIVSTVTLFTAKIQTFRRAELEQAFTFLNLDKKERSDALKHIKEMDALVAPASK